MLRTTTSDIDELKAQIEQLTARIAKSDPSISVEKIDVQGDVNGTIVVGNRNVIGDNNIIYEVNTLYGTFIQPHELSPSIRKRPPSQPPHSPRRFVGRDRELGLLEEHIRNKQPVLLHGQSGVGKTTLLQKIANSEAAKSLPDGVIYLEPLYEGNKLSFQDILQRLFDRLFVSEPRVKLNEPHSQGSSILDFLNHLVPKWFEPKSTTNSDDSLIEANLTTTAPLILLDEMGIEQAALNRLSRLFPKGDVIATAQNAPADDVYEGIRVAPLSREEAIQLFAEKSGLPAEANWRPFMDQICGILEDVPLAITMIANGIRQNRIPLENREEPQSNSLPWLLNITDPPSQDRVQTAIERSFKLLFMQLNPQEQDYLAAVAAAPGKSLDREWLRTYTGGDGKKELDALEDLQLVYANSPRLRLPEVLRGYLQSPPQDWYADLRNPFQPILSEDQYLARAPVLAQSREALHGFYVDHLGQPSQDSDFASAELGNILGLLQLAFQAKRWVFVIKLGKAIDSYLALNGLWDAWGTVLRKVEVAAQKVGDASSRAWALHQLGTREIGVGNRVPAIALLKRALELRLRSGDVMAAKYTLHNLQILASLPPNPDPPDPGPEPNPPPEPEPSLLEILRTFISEKLWPLVTSYGSVLAGTAVMLALVAGVLVQPSLKFTPQAAQERYSINDQEIEYVYEIDNAGFVPIVGPIFVTHDKVKVRCQELQDIGNGDTSLDWNETIKCTGFYLISKDDIKKGSVSGQASIRTAGENGKAGIQSMPRSIVVLLDTDDLTMLVEAQPGEFEQAGETITIAYIVKNNGTADLSGPIQVHTDGKLPVTCPDQPQGVDSDILGAGEFLTCTASYTITEADLKSCPVTSKVWASAGKTDSESHTLTINCVPPSPEPPPSPTPTPSSGTPQTPTPTLTPSSGTPQSPTPSSGTPQSPTPTSLSGTPQTPTPTLTSSSGTPQSPTPSSGTPQSPTPTPSSGTPQSPTLPGPQPIPFFFETPPPLLIRSVERRRYAAGEEITYLYVVVNQGSILVAGPVRVKDDMAEVKCPEIDRGVEPGQSITCRAVYRTTEEDVRRGSVTNIAVAYIGQSTSKPQSLTVYLQTEPSNLTLIKHADPETYQEPGQKIRYSYLVTNDGRYPLKGPLTVRDDKAAVSCPDVNTTGDGDSVLDPGERLVCSAVYTITEIDLQNGSVTNSARASMDGVDSNPDAVTVTASALELAITADRQSYENVGDTIRYEYVITGRSKAPLPGQPSIAEQNDQIKIDCPAVNSTGNGDDFLDWDESLTCTGEHLITQADIDIARPGSDRGAITNSARASMGGVTSRQVQVEVIGPVQQPALSLAVTADTSRFDSVDQKITYTYMITNAGNVTIPAPIQITDDHIDRGAPFQCGDAARRLAPGESMTCTRSYAITQEDFGPKSVTNSATASSSGMNLPINSSTVTATVSCQYREGWIPYTVEPDETWEHILSWYQDMTAADLQKANCLGSASSVGTGQILYVPRQPPSAAISGVMSDSTGQALQNTPIILTNIASGSSTTTYTGATGEYTFSDLEPGTYRIFQVLITVRRGDTKTQDFVIVAGTP